jgi:hypothetical protein
MFAKHEGDEAKACADVEKKYFTDFAKTKDLHFFLGTTYVNHFRSSITVYHYRNISP